MLRSAEDALQEARRALCARPRLPDGTDARTQHYSNPGFSKCSHVQPHVLELSLSPILGSAEGGAAGTRAGGGFWVDTDMLADTRARFCRLFWVMHSK